MKLLTQQDLIKAGYQVGPNFPFLLARISELEAKGITDKKYALKLLKRQLPPNDLRAVLREKPLEFTKAIIPETDDEKANFKKVSQKMNELLRSPIITAGTILPDACPAGNGDAVIPVGGAVIAQNAIIPSAHSADICCSMYATFYEPRSSVSSELDALITATRFGPGHRHMDDLVYDVVLNENVWDNPFLNGLRDRAHAHIADQGDGNHFAYLGEVTVEPSLLSLLEKNNYSDLTSLLSPHRGKTLRVLVTHHGSRGLGAHVYKRGQKLPGSMPLAQKASLTGMLYNMLHVGRKRTTEPFTVALSNASKGNPFVHLEMNTTSSGSVVTTITMEKERLPPGQIALVDHRWASSHSIWQNLSSGY